MYKDRTTLAAFIVGMTILVAGSIAVIIMNWSTVGQMRPPEFSRKNMLQATWHHYKENYIEDGTYRSIDRQRDDVTTSEGQSYSMMRAVWMDDKQTFDGSWQWTKDNLRRTEDRLFSWLFGQRGDGSYGVLTDRGGYNSAVDADVDIAVALLFAHKRWGDEVYFGDAIVVIRDIWEKVVVDINGRPYLAANDLEKKLSKPFVIINPSYLSPYAYKMFAEVDPDRDWLGLASTSYEVALQSTRLPLDKASSANLPPDWVAIETATGNLTAVPQPTTLTTNFSFDALRLPWRFALDWLWYEDQRAKEVLESMGTLMDEWKGNGTIMSSYSHDGARLVDFESPAMYGGVIGYFMVQDSDEADNLYRQKLESLFDPNESMWKERLSYYDDNWAWFGTALYAGELNNLFEI